MKRIKEIIGLLQEGATEPMLCRADDGRAYAVKHRGCGRDALIREWIAGRIGRKLDLPIPDIELLTLAASKAPYIAVPGADHLAACPSFGSCFVESTVLFTPALKARVPDALRAGVLLFDWWVRNGDRTDGNSNLLWKASESELWVIDHNLAFDAAEDAAEFWSDHIFRDGYRSWDAGFRERMGLRMRAIIAELPDLWEELPTIWTDNCNTTYEAVDRILNRCNSPEFWNVP